jgi:NAD(P)-dependent dehydrogenase (short-subunit alcohol dehydrogenase family)
MDKKATSGSAQGRAVVITGCSSGIGQAAAKHLARRSYLVLATVRREKDADALRGLGDANLVPVCPLDMTRRDHIPPVIAAVRAELRRRGIDGLYALINNAGGGAVAPAELLDPEDFRRELDGRLVGGLALVQACLPLIRQAAGRILWIATPALMPTPYVTSIHASDFAVNCLARTLDIELQAWNIPNVLIRCGGIKTPAGLRTSEDAEACLRKAPADRVPLYADSLRAWVKDMAAFDAKRTDAERVAELIEKVLAARNPKRRYSIGHMVRAAAFLGAMPQGMADRILRRRFRPR